MDLKTHILQWQHEIAENHAILVLVIFIGVAAIFLIVLLCDTIFKWRRQSKRNRRR